jgi:hypothetical protein
MYAGKSIGQGRERVRSALLESQELRAGLLEETLAFICSGAPLPPPARSTSPDEVESSEGASVAA